VFDGKKVKEVKQILLIALPTVVAAIHPAILPFYTIISLVITTEL